jgi:hypothetical protein
MDPSLENSLNLIISKEQLKPQMAPLYQFLFLLRLYSSKENEQDKN